MRKLFIIFLTIINVFALNSCLDKRVLRMLQPIKDINNHKSLSSLYQGIDRNDYLLLQESNKLNIYSDIYMSELISQIEIEGRLLSLKSLYLSSAYNSSIKQGSYLAFTTSCMNEIKLNLFVKYEQSKIYTKIFTKNIQEDEIIGYLINNANNKLYLVTKSRTNIKLYSVDGYLTSSFQLDQESIVSSININEVINHISIYNGKNLNIYKYNDEKLTIVHHIALSDKFILNKSRLMDNTNFKNYCVKYFYVYNGYSLYFISNYTFDIVYEIKINYLYSVNSNHYFHTDQGLLYVDIVFNNSYKSFDVYRHLFKINADPIYSYSNCDSKSFIILEKFESKYKLKVISINVDNNQKTQTIFVNEDYLMPFLRYDIIYDSYTSNYYVISEHNIYFINDYVENYNIEILPIYKSK